MLCKGWIAGVRILVLKYEAFNFARTLMPAHQSQRELEIQFCLILNSLSLWEYWWNVITKHERKPPDNFKNL